MHRYGFELTTKALDALADLHALYPEHSDSEIVDWALCSLAEWEDRRKEIIREYMEAGGGSRPLPR